MFTFKDIGVAIVFGLALLACLICIVIINDQQELRHQEGGYQCEPALKNAQIQECESMPEQQCRVFQEETRWICTPERKCVLAINAKQVDDCNVRAPECRVFHGQLAFVCKK